MWLSWPVVVYTVSIVRSPFDSRLLLASENKTFALTRLWTELIFIVLNDRLEIEVQLLARTSSISSLISCAGQ